MPSGALGSISKVSSKFIHEVLPVATASVIGTILINHYSHQPSPPSIVVQAPPRPASADELFQTLRDEHALIADYLKRKQDSAATRQVDDAAEVTSADATPLPVAEVHRAEPRPAPQEKVAARSSKPAPKKKSAPADPPPLPPDPPLATDPSLALDPPFNADPAPVPAPAQPPSRARPILRVAGAVRDWVVDAAQLPGRALVLAHFYDSPEPSMVAPLRRHDLLRPD